MKTKNNELSRNLVITGLLTAFTVALAVAVQRKRAFDASADRVFSSCESALDRLGNQFRESPHRI
jgi:hypothetical protein